MLTANPLEDDHHAAQRAEVVVRGRWFAEQDLKAELERRAQAFEAWEKH